MLVLRNPKNDIPIIKNNVLSIGGFDGIHRAHKKIIKQTIKTANSANAKSMILTFEPYPKKFFQQNIKNFRITNLKTKLKILKDLKIDIVILMSFNQPLARLKAIEFIEKILVKTFEPVAIVTGENFFFGRNRKGNIQTLSQNAAKYNFRFEAIKNMTYNHQTISSSLIRQMINKGKTKNAAKMLGHLWGAEGYVISGDKRGHNIGFPTANMVMPKDLVNPKPGVYAVIAQINKKSFKAIANFGTKPSFNGKKLLLETHIFNFAQDIYGHKIRILFVDYIREEKVFPSIDEIKKQIQKDIKKAKLILDKIYDRKELYI